MADGVVLFLTSIPIAIMIIPVRCSAALVEPDSDRRLSWRDEPPCARADQNGHGPVPKELEEASNGARWRAAGSSSPPPRRCRESPPRYSASPVPGRSLCPWS
jgi:hypothetical protein